MRPLCAICGKRSASAQTSWDDRMVDCCSRCVAPVADPGISHSPEDDTAIARVAVRIAMHHDGISSEGVSDALGYLDTHMRNAVSTALFRAVASGALTVRVIAGVRFYFPGARKTCERCSRRYIPTTASGRFCGVFCAQRAKATTRAKERREVA